MFTPFAFVKQEAAAAGNGPLTTAFLAATGITDATITTALNNLETGLTTYSLGSKMVALYPMVGGTASAHKFNLKDPRDLDAAFRLVFSGGMTHSSTGVLFNGVNGYGNTFLNRQFKHCIYFCMYSMMF